MGYPSVPNAPAFLRDERVLSINHANISLVSDWIGKPFAG